MCISSKLLICLTILASSYRAYGLMSQLRYMYRGEEDTYFQIYTPQSQHDPLTYNLKNLSSLQASDKFDPSLEMRVLIPGRFASSSISQQFFAKYAECGGLNYVHVDWRKGSDTHFQQIVELNIAPAGSVVAKFLTKLEEMFSLDMSKVCIISKGVGVAVAGEAGHKMGNISCILGLDPTPTLFARNLQRDDAQYVQVMHSTSSYVNRAALGDADFYIEANEDELKKLGCSPNQTCYHSYSSNVYFETLCNSKYTACRKHHKGDCGYIMGGEPLQVYKGQFEIELSD